MEPIYLNAVWIGFFFLVLVLILPNSGTTNRWINLGFIGFQPSELMRFLLPISAAAYLTRNPQIKLSDWIIVLVTTLVAFILVFLQPDFGTSAIVLLSGIMPIILSGLPWRFIIYSFLGGIGTLPFLWMSLMDYQKERIYTFISPEADALGSGWNIAQSKIAIGSGQFFGKGYMEGSQSQLDFIPESHTDFIFAVIVEEFGFLGTLAFDYPRRSKFFTKQLEHFLLLTREEKLDPLVMKGSYAGAMGYGQFIPSSYRSYAIDFDDDGIRNIVTNPIDAIGSVANYLSKHRHKLKV